jgi:hypothetical protein
MLLINSLPLNNVVNKKIKIKVQNVQKISILKNLKFQKFQKINNIENKTLKLFQVM